MKTSFMPVLLFVAAVTFNSAEARQAQNESLVSKFDDLTNRWYLVSSEMKTYDGLKKYCNDQAYREHIMDVLEEIHHYDSLLYERVSLKARFDSGHEIKKVLHQIEQFEEKYSAASFSTTLRLECSEQRQVERHASETRNDIGSASYDSQVVVLEAHLNKYVNHITRLMDHIKEHIHHLHIE